jgi:hypothetical protein
MKRSLALITLSLILLIGGAFQAQAAITLVQATSSNCGNANATTCTLSFGSSTTAGDFFVLIANIGAQSATVSATSTQNDTFLNALQFNQTTAGNSQVILYALNVVGGSTSITFSKTSTAVKNRITIAEFSGVATTNAVDTVASGTGASSPSNSGNITTATSTELLIGGYTNANGGSTSTFTSNNSFITLGSSTCPTTICEAAQYRITTSTITVSSSFTYSAGTNWSQGIVGFLPAGSTSTPSPKDTLFFAAN